MRQGLNENIGNYIKRYEDTHTRLQNALDSVPVEYRESLRYMEKIHIKKFVESLRTEIEIRLMTAQPATLREAFSEAQRIEKKLRDDEVLRRGKLSTFAKADDHLPKSQGLNEKSGLDFQPKNSQVQEKSKLTLEERNKKYFCKHCKTSGHSDSRCFRLHPELKNRNFPSTLHPSRPPNENLDETQHYSSGILEQTSSTDTW